MAGDGGGGGGGDDGRDGDLYVEHCHVMADCSSPALHCYISLYSQT